MKGDSLGEARSREAFRGALRQTDGPTLPLRLRRNRVGHDWASIPGAGELVPEKRRRKAEVHVRELVMPYVVLDLRPPDLTEPRDAAEERVELAVLDVHEPMADLE